MSHKRKGQLTSFAERAKHLRKYMRRRFWKGERKAEATYIQHELDESKNVSPYISDGTFKHSLQQLVDAIAYKHQTEGITVYPPVNSEVFQAFEHHAGFALPEDFKLFYTVCNGFACNENLFNFKSLTEFILFPDDIRKDGFYFAEYMINCDMWYVRCFPDGSYEIFSSGNNIKPVTTSLELFLHHFLRGGVFDPDGLYAWQEKLKINEA